jgi:hypothetical protein
MQAPHHAIPFQWATGPHALGVAAFLTILAMVVSVVTAPFVLPTMTTIDPGEALRRAVIVAAIAYTVVLLALMR